MACAKHQARVTKTVAYHEVPPGIARLRGKVFAADPSERGKMLTQSLCTRLADMERGTDGSYRGDTISCELSREHHRYLILQRIGDKRLVMLVGGRHRRLRTADDHHQQLVGADECDRWVVTVTTLWADERLYYPVHAVPYTPARHFARSKSDPAFRTKLKIGADLAIKARDAGFAFRAVAADSAYGDQDGFRGELAGAGLPFVMALKRDLGLRPGRAYPRGRRPRAGLGRPGQPGRLAPGDPHVP